MQKDGNKMEFQNHFPHNNNEHIIQYKHQTLELEKKFWLHMCCCVDGK